MKSIMYVLADREYREVKEEGYQTVRADGGLLQAVRMIRAALEENAEGDIRNIGVCYYDRYFIKAGRLLSIEDMDKLLEEKEVILPQQTDGRLMLMMRKSFFDSFCDWLGGCTAKQTQRQAAEKDGAAPLESMFEPWLEEQGIAVGRQQAETIDTGRMAAMYELIEQLTGELIGRYQKGAYLHLPPIDTTVGQGGRMPVWVCWWQGEEQAPLLVQKCIARIRGFFPPDRADVRIITFDNYRQYVEFSETVTERFREGTLSLTHLSDVLRAQLLCRYGGLWMDATYYIWDDRFIDTLLQFPFYTQKQGGLPNELDIISGRWANNFMKGPAGFPLFGFMVEAFELYWDRYDVLKNYFLFDYIIAVAYDNLREVRFILDACPVNNTASQVLADWGNRPYDEQKMQLLTRDTWLFKLTYKKTYAAIAENGAKTFYGVWMERE